MISTNIKSNINVVVILGPTSSGKSDAAISLAKKFDGEVISADSRQVYRDMNLGTGKVEGEWKDKFFVSENIPHHLLDFRSPRGTYNVSQFQKDCNRLIGEIGKQGKLPIICGGTGFWISAVVNEFVLPNVEPNKKLRQRLGKKTAEQLHEQLKKLDLVRAKNIDQKNKFRLIRAIEICKSLGSVPSLKKGEVGKISDSSKKTKSKIRLTPPPTKEKKEYEFLQIGIDWPQEKLDQKIKKRLEGRWTDGMIKEVKSLRRKYALSWKKIQSFGLAYFWIPLYLQKKLSLKELKEKVFIAERRYAKRQRTWFRRDKRIVWENDAKRINKAVSIFLEE